MDYNVFPCCHHSRELWQEVLRPERFETRGKSHSSIRTPSVHCHRWWSNDVHDNCSTYSMWKHGFYYCISLNVGRYFGLVTGPPPPPAMEAMEATERFRRERSSVANLTRINLIFWIYLTYTLIQTPIENWVHISKIDRLLTDWPSIMSMGFGGDTSTRHLCRAAV